MADNIQAKSSETFTRLIEKIHEQNQLQLGTQLFQLKAERDIDKESIKGEKQLDEIIKALKEVKNSVVSVREAVTGLKLIANPEKQNSKYESKNKDTKIKGSKPAVDSKSIITPKRLSEAYLKEQEKENERPRFGNLKDFGQGLKEGFSNTKAFFSGPVDKKEEAKTKFVEAYSRSATGNQFQKEGKSSKEVGGELFEKIIKKEEEIKVLEQKIAAQKDSGFQPLKKDLKELEKAEKGLTEIHKDAGMIPDDKARKPVTKEAVITGINPKADKELKNAEVTTNTAKTDLENSKEQLTLLKEQLAELKAIKTALEPKKEDDLNDKIESKSKVPVSPGSKEAKIESKSKVPVSPGSKEAKIESKSKVPVSPGSKVESKSKVPGSKVESKSKTLGSKEAKIESKSKVPVSPGSKVDKAAGQSTASPVAGGLVSKTESPIAGPGQHKEPAPAALATPVASVSPATPTEEKGPGLLDVASTAGDLLSYGRGGGTAGKAGKGIGSKILGGLGKAAKFLGPAAAIAGAAYSGFEGYQNTNQNFDLKEGQDATTGQKVSSTLGGIASGATFGLLDEKTASQGIHKAGEAISNAASTVGGVASNAAGMVGNAASNAAGAVSNVASAAGSYVGDKAKSIGNSISNFFSSDKGGESVGSKLSGVLSKASPAVGIAKGAFDSLTSQSKKETAGIPALSNVDPMGSSISVSPNAGTQLNKLSTENKDMERDAVKAPAPAAPIISNSVSNSDTTKYVPMRAAPRADSGSSLDRYMNRTAVY